MSHQLALFEAPASAAPEGFAYRPGLITPEEEQALAARFASLPFKPYEFRGYLGARRTVAYGWRYADDGKAIEPVQAIPDFLQGVRAKAAAFAGLEPDELAQALVIDYPPGAPIGWHRDRPAFGQVVGVSLLAPAPLRLRLERPDGGWDRVTQVLEPRSAYLLSGPARHRWRHSIPPLDQQRYSITFRTLTRR
ncbi:MAG: alpha-ketoglutarate-dependent dioxygenase AlkB [Caulobacteraceae bacterium]